MCGAREKRRRGNANIPGVEGGGLRRPTFLLPFREYLPTPCMQRGERGGRGVKEKERVACGATFTGGQTSRLCHQWFLGLIHYESREIGQTAIVELLSSSMVMASEWRRRRRSVGEME